jgi:hypothetical protein
MKRSIPTIDFETARALLDYISPLNSTWHAGRFIFRGQPSDAYELTPSVCRRGRGSFADGSVIKGISDTVSGQIYFELEILSQFLQGCDKSGLVVPGYTKEIKRKLMENRGQFLSRHNPWPQPELHEIMAVAQHYDVPTRLLDWTERSFVACYFAASSAEFEIHSTTTPRIAVWALDTKFSSDWKTVSIIRTPGGTSENQAAQSGLFTTHSITEFGEDYPYEVEAMEDMQDIFNKDDGSSSLIKMTLPVDQAPELLDLCSKLGVHGATLFPGFHGVGRSVRDWANIQVGVRPSDELRDEYLQQFYDPD